MLSFDPKAVLIAAFLRDLEAAFVQLFGHQPDHLNALGRVANLAMETLANTTCLYHRMDHSMLVTMVGQEIVRGKVLREGRVCPTDWLNVVAALLLHDIGYVHGVHPGDRDGWAVIDEAGNGIVVPPGATDAVLTPYHVERGEMFVRWRFGGHPLLNCDFICRCIEHTRFPVPARDDVTANDWPGLVRCADLIGQMADPDYLLKLPALFHEFEETGTNKRLGNRTPADLRRNYPSFYWNSVHNHIGDGIRFLEVTLEGRRWVANLLANVFVPEAGSLPAPDRREAAPLLTPA